MKVHFMVSWKWQDFVSRAASTPHPFARIVCDDAVWRAVHLLATRGPQAFCDLRLRELARWRVRARELEQEEQQLHRSLHRDVLGSVGKKRLLLLREILREAGFPCADRVFEGMHRGFSILGDIPPTGVFPADVGKTASMTEEGLRQEATAARRCLRAGRPPQDDADVVEAVYAETLAEVERGWLRGPFSEEQLDARHTWWVPCRRFGVSQGAKVRAVDDYSIFGHNLGGPLA